MKSGKASARRMPGQPLLALLAVPLAWTAFRLATMGEAYADDILTLETLPQSIVAASDPARAHEPPSSFAPLHRIALPESQPRTFANVATPRSRLASLARIQTAPAIVPTTTEVAFAPKALIAHQETLKRTGPAKDATNRKSTIDRWRLDAWLALREGSQRTGTIGGTLPLYGASQAGAVLRYDLSPGSRFRPAAYVRVVKALVDQGETNLAVGLAARPFDKIPVTAHVEARASLRDGKVEVRPAAFAAGGFDDAALPFGVSARGYAQAGYVGGRFATAFADGSTVVEKRIGIGKAEIGVGGGVWGGVQRGAGRLDLGPTASTRFRLGSGTGRLAVDYRWRAAGNASPASGAALTLSAGF